MTAAQLEEQAKALHIEHCRKYGVPPNWDGITENAKAFLIRKAKRILGALQSLPPGRNSAGEATYAVSPDRFPPIALPKP